jgi:hypothetical protein
VYSGNHYCLETLLKNGAHIDEKINYNGFTALHLAAFIGDKKCVSLLLKEGANVMIKTINGKFAHDIARYSDDCMRYDCMRGNNSPYYEGPWLDNYNSKYKSCEIILNQKFDAEKDRIEELTTTEIISSPPAYSGTSSPAYSRPSPPAYSRPSPPTYSGTSSPAYSRPSPPAYSDTN